MITIWKQQALQVSVDILTLTLFVLLTSHTHFHWTIGCFEYSRQGTFTSLIAHDHNKAEWNERTWVPTFVI